MSIRRRFKVVIVGDSFTGKTSLLQRLITQQYHQSDLSTIVSSCHTATLPLTPNPLQIDLWDTAGQERFRSLASNFFHGAHGVIVCYDVTSPKSFKHIGSWVEEIQNSASDAVWMIVGCKSDCDAIVTNEEAQQLAKEYGVQCMACSAKRGENVVECFVELGKLMLDKQGNNVQIREEEAEEIIFEKTVKVQNITDSKHNHCC
ncbi:Small GTPase rabi [Entamoeba marina]